jgi:hypothetical protein
MLENVIRRMLLYYIFIEFYYITFLCFSTKHWIISTKVYKDNLRINLMSLIVFSEFITFISSSIQPLGRFWQ